MNPPPDLARRTRCRASCSALCSLCHRADLRTPTLRPAALMHLLFTAVVTNEDGSTVQLAYACGTDGWYLHGGRG
ncbi:MAG: hypothetical protein ACLVJH_09005 [Faecalibacterium prausnitzii]